MKLPHLAVIMFVPFLLAACNNATPPSAHDIASASQADIPLDNSSVDPSPLDTNADTEEGAQEPASQASEHLERVLEGKKHPSLDEYKAYMEENAAYHGVEIIGEPVLLDSTVGYSHRVHILAFPVAVDGQEAYWGVDIEDGRIYQWNGAPGSRSPAREDRIETLPAFRNHWEMANYIECHFDALTYERQSPLEAYQDFTLYIENNDRTAYTYCDGSFFIISKTKGSESSTVLSYDIYEAGFLSGPEEIRIVTAQEAEALRENILEGNLLNLVDDLLDSMENVRGFSDIAIADFDDSGNRSLFVSILSNGEDNDCGSILYYLANGQAQAVCSLEATGSCFTKVIAIDGKKFLALRSRGIYIASGWREALYGVHDGVAYETNLSERAMGLSANAYGELTAAHSTYDFSTDGTGHTWKPYYFYWENGEFREYGGIPITLQQARTLDSALEIPEDYPDSAFTTGYYRANGIVNLNYTLSRYDSYGHNYFLSYRYEDGKLNLIPEDENEGFYLPAMMEDLATYPASLPMK